MFIDSKRKVKCMLLKNVRVNVNNSLIFIDLPCLSIFCFAFLKRFLLSLDDVQLTQ
jgi:hypothetical protein